MLQSGSVTRPTPAPVAPLRSTAILLAAPLLAAPILAAPPNDPLYPQQTQLHAPVCDVEGAWLATRGDPRIVIAVADSGADYGHEDIVEQYYVNVAEAAASGVTDRNGNGVIDRQDCALAGAGNGIDDDGDGYAEGAVYDTDYNGCFDFAIADTDGDGLDDTAYYDYDEDGIVDEVIVAA